LQNFLRFIQAGIDGNLQIRFTQKRGDGIVSYDNPQLSGLHALRQFGGNFCGMYRMIRPIYGEQDTFEHWQLLSAEYNLSLVS
jgi:hypothetical protein